MLPHDVPNQAQILYCGAGSSQAYSNLVPSEIRVSDEGVLLSASESFVSSTLGSHVSSSSSSRFASAIASARELSSAFAKRLCVLPPSVCRRSCEIHAKYTVSVFLLAPCFPARWPLWKTATSFGWTELWLVCIAFSCTSGPLKSSQHFHRRFLDFLLILISWDSFVYEGRERGAN